MLLPKYLWFIFTPQNAPGSFLGRKTLQQCKMTPSFSGSFHEDASAALAICYSRPMKSECFRGTGGTGASAAGFLLAPWPRQQRSSRRWVGCPWRSTRAPCGLAVNHSFHPCDTRETTVIKRMASANTSTRPSVGLLQNCCLRQVTCSFTTPVFSSVSQK